MAFLSAGANNNTHTPDDEVDEVAMVFADSAESANELAMAS